MRARGIAMAGTLYAIFRLFGGPLSEVDAARFSLILFCSLFLPLSLFLSACFVCFFSTLINATGIALPCVCFSILGTSPHSKIKTTTTSNNINEKRDLHFCKTSR